MLPDQTSEPVKKRSFFNLLNDSLLWRLLSESIPSQKRKYILAVIAMVLVAASSAGAAWVMGAIVNELTEPSSSGGVYWVAGIVVLIFMVRGFASFFQVVYMTRAGNRIVAEKQALLYSHILSQGLDFFDQNASSELLMRVNQSAQRARQVIDVIVNSVVRDLLTLLGLFGVMVYQQPVLSLLSLSIGPFIYFGMRKILAKVKGITQQEMMGIAEIMRVVQETSRGSRVIKAFSMEDTMQLRMQDALVTVEERSNRIARLGATTTPLLETLTGILIGGMVVLSSISFIGQEGNQAGQLMSFVTALIMAYEPAKRLSRMRVRIEAGLAGVQMMYELLDQTSNLTEAENATDIPIGAGAITLENVSFAYTDGQQVINDISLDITPGKVLALVGPSGGGKSTFVNLLMRMYDPTEGRILIDGHDIKSATFASLKRQFAFVAQDTFMFSDTVKENLKVGRPDATDEDIYEAAKLANAHAFIKALPNGYDTHVGENATSLSGGQRQRLSIARALLRDAPIMLLDEATSALDGHSERAVRDALDIATKDRTTIVIAHRLSTILSADFACFIEDGRIVEFGVLSELQRKEGGRLKDMFDQQISTEQ